MPYLSHSESFLESMDSKPTQLQSRNMPLNQHFQKVVQASFDAFAQHETMLPRKATGVMTTPQNQVVGLRDDDQFFVLFHRGLRCSSQQQVEAQAVKITGGDFQSSTAFGGMGVKDKW